MARSELREACSSGDFEKVKRMIEEGADVNEANNHGFTPLYHATKKGHTEIVKLLLESGANVNCVTETGKSLIQLASEKGHALIIKLLVGYGASVEEKENMFHFTPLMNAGYNGHLNAVRVLLQKGADPNQTSKAGTTALGKAIRYKRESIVLLFLKYKSLLCESEKEKVEGRTYKVTFRIMN